jgi:hypothetical protein
VELVFLILLAVLIRSLVDYIRGEGKVKTDLSGMNMSASRFETIRLPIRKSIKGWFRRIFKSRRLLPSEFGIDCDLENSKINVIFFVPRRLLAINLTFVGDRRISVKKVYADGSESSKPFTYGIRYDLRGNQVTARLGFSDTSPVKKIVLDLVDGVKDYNYKIDINCYNEKDPDFILLSEGLARVERGDDGAAEKKLLEYEKYAGDNPNVSLQLSNIYFRSEDYRAAEEYAIRAAIDGLFEDSMNLYRNIHENKERFSPVGEISSLRDKAADWDLQPHYGIVILRKRQEYSLCFKEYYERRYSEILLIRRPAAARMLRKVGFNIDRGKELLLESSARIIDIDDNLEDLPDENFVISDSVGRNVFITVEDEKECGWILPDLKAGDIVEWNYSILHRGKGDGADPENFILTDMYDPYNPTYQAQVAFEVPSGKELFLTSKNEAVEEEKETATDKGKDRYLFSDQKYSPAKNTGYYYENYYLNPVIGCSNVKRSWEDVSRRLRKIVLGEHFDDEKLPEILKFIIDNSADREAALENCFYWIRDLLKYGSMISGTKSFGKDERAASIVEKGLGNCNDKTYLLCMICRELGVPFEIIGISAKEGILFEDLCVDQFDHVFMRAWLGSRWVYLDAASTFSVYGSPPPVFQGLDALMVSENGGDIRRLPEDDPLSNLVEISETIDKLENGWLKTGLRISAAGHSARGFDEQLKSISLSHQNQFQAAEAILRDFLPSLVISAFEKTKNTANSNFCEIHGQGQRCPVVPLGDRLMANLRWNIPSLPMAHWRILTNDRLFVFAIPLTIRLELAFKGEALGRLEDISRLQDLQSEICDIRELYERNSDFLKVTRIITIKNKYMRSRQMKDFPAIMGKIEDTLQAVAAFSE